ncbi:serine/threonine protein kinase [Streptomyces sp. M2CJ-2]|uniref:serine/threonine-protein kinase n=1 Tax=Streptomyces sp. M2CJ-2 TaxID=2803948 RepID=UPI0019272207|nr:serine/threonine-protein kinase [Streptomyces sp. M2CJ-2]MBL3670704.1 serine/threonine protein kinase [Streptomyces sp. M2CJ-2]
MNHTAEVFQPLRDDDPRAVAGYRLAARLGAGGMGRVYLSHTRGGRPVAVKVVRSELADDPAFRQRFGREIKAARKVKGAYTAELIDADPDGAPPWLATLYVPGPSLTEAVTRRGPLPVPAVLWLMAGVAEALQAIHGAGIVHRDLKPSNVLLASDGPRVIDFGISLAADGTAHTATGATVGTPQYMAPEQAVAGDVTAATDVFALGQAAAFAALGEPLYGDGPAVSVLYRIVHSEPDLSGLPERLRGLIARCLAADPGERVTPAEIVEWCRRELGQDADAGAGPAVWREIAGPEVTVPPPAPEFPAPTAAYTWPLGAPQPSAVPLGPAAAPWPAVPPWPTGPQGPTGPDERKRRRRRAALIPAAVLAAVGLLLTAVWTAVNAMEGDRDRDRDTAASASGTPGPAAGRSSASGKPSSGSAPTGEAASSTGPEATSSAASDMEVDGPAGGAGTPRAHAYPGQLLTAENSLSIGSGDLREDRKGDIRFGCSEVGCELESDTSVFTGVYGDPGDGTYETCRMLTASQDARLLSLAAAAAGTEICVKDGDGNVGLLVIQTKSTALPELGFVTADVTVWRAD